MITSYKEMTLGLYQELQAVIKKHGGNDLECSPYIIALLSGKTTDEVLNLPVSQYSALADKAAFIFAAPPRVPVMDEYTVGGLRCVPTRDLAKITAAQYIDMMTYLQNPDPDLAEVLSAMLVPVGHAYNDGYDVAEVKEGLRELPIADALALERFFVGCAVKSAHDTLTYGMRRVRRKRLTMKRSKRKEVAALLTKAKRLSEVLRTLGDGLQQ